LKLGVVEARGVLALFRWEMKWYGSAMPSFLRETREYGSLVLERT
jgi:hypothetical protein